MGRSICKSSRYDILEAYLVTFPKIIYALELWQRDDQGRPVLVDQKVYDADVLSLGAKSSVHKNVTYTVPEYLRGSYVLRVEARNPDALVLGTVDLPAAVVLTGTDAYVKVDQSHCYLAIEGDPGNKTYLLTQGVDVAANETLQAHCSLTSTLAGSQSVVPVFRTYYRSAFGKLIRTDQQDPITLKSGQKSDFVATIALTSDPQAYDAVLQFVDGQGTAISSPIVFHYVLHGESATIQNLKLDKNSYKKGETAQALFLWSGMADSFPDSRLGSDGYGQPINATFTLVDGQQKPCADPFVRSLNADTQGGVENFSIPVTNDCQNPTIVAKIDDQSGKSLAENTYDLSVDSANPSRAASATSTDSNQGNTSNTKRLLIYAGIVVLLILVGLVWRYRTSMKRRRA